MMKIELIEKYLDELFENPQCELNYTKDYELLMAIVLSAQSTDKRVNMCTGPLFKKYDSLEKMMNAPIEDIKEMIRPIGSFNKKSEYLIEIAKILVEKYDGKVPKEREILESFPGVGRKTTNVFLSEYYQIPSIAVDTHVERVSKRLRLANKKDNVRTIEEKLMKKFKKEEWGKRHLQLVLFGRYYCKAMKPECENCRLKDICTDSKKKLAGKPKKD